MRPTWLEVDLDALRANYRAAAALAGGGPVLAVVKGNAYGHGLVPVARALAGAGAGGPAYFGVATVGEGSALRAAGIETPILLLGGYLPEEAPEIVALGLSPAVFAEAQVAPLAAAARAAGVRLAVHLKVDTGMGRIGVAAEAAPALLRRLLDDPDLAVEGVFSHFAEADLADSPAAQEQLARLLKVRAELGPAAGSVRYWHTANSAALMRRLGAGGDVPVLFRPGIMLYGHPPAAGFAVPVPLTPVGTWKARVIQVKRVPAGTPISYGRTFVTTRESVIATLPVGYADGYSRALSNRGRVLLKGVPVPVAGRVCMDMTMVDVTDLHEAVAIGDEAVLMGAQGEAAISATQVAEACGTIAYDILCAVSERVPRRYVGGSA
jgi:alanine racemase